MKNTESEKNSESVQKSHLCDENCIRTAAGKCKVVVRERNARHYEANRERVLSEAAKRRRYAQEAIASYEASQKKKSK